MKKNNKGFTLLELSIVLLIMGFITTTSLTVTKGILDVNKQKITKERIYKIEDAINAYIVKNGRLPCPAGMKNKYTTTSNIKENRNTTYCKTDETEGIKLNNNVYIGTIPTDTLNLQKNNVMDGWSNKFVYVVVKNYTESDNFTKDVSNDSLINDKFIYAIISNGKNMYYSYNYNGNEELKNKINSTNDKSNSYGGITNNTIIENGFNSDIDDIILLKSLDSIKQELNFIDTGCKIIKDNILNQINNICGSEYFTDIEEIDLKYNNKRYSNEIFYNTKTIQEDDGTTKEIKTQLKQCVIKCSDYGRIIIYLNITDI